MSAGRLRVYLAPCASVGFGSCDQGFAEIFLANQFNPFPLHRKATSKKTGMCGRRSYPEGW